MTVKADLINPFIASTRDLFNSVLASEAVPGEARPSESSNDEHDIIAWTGLSGTGRSMLALLLPVDTALNMVNRSLSMDFPVVNAAVSNALAEMVTSVAASAVAEGFGGSRSPLGVSPPMVIRGNGCALHSPAGAASTDVAFHGELGRFVLRVAFEEDVSAPG